MRCSLMGNMCEGFNLHSNCRIKFVVSLFLVYARLYPLLGLLGQVVHGLGEVEDLSEVEASNADAGGVPGHVVGVVVSLAVFSSSHFTKSGLSTSHEVVEEVVEDLDHVHDGLGALDDLPVERGLDVGLYIVDKVFLNIILEVL